MRPSVLVVAALLMGAVAAFLVSRWVGIGSPAGAGSSVVVAVGRIESGVPVGALQLKVVRWPAASTPSGSFSDPGKLEGRVARQEIHDGEPVLDSKLAPIGTKGGLSAVISPGKRAITVRVNDVVAVAGFTLPGSFVDVLVSAKDSSGVAFSKIVLSRVKVLAVAQDLTATDPAKPKVVNAVTLELSPQDAEQLDLARSIGSLSLVLRNETDRSLASHSSGARLSDLISSAPVITTPSRVATSPVTKASVRRSSTKAVLPPPSEKVEEIRGTQRSEVLL